jgi:chitin disaccharide deacetylase
VLSLLGLAPETRALIVNADDFGMRHSVNSAIAHSLESGIVTSTSLMMPCPWAYDAVSWLQAHPEVPFGVHLTIVRDVDGYRWGPLSGRDAVPSLVDETGHFRKFDGGRTLPETARLDDIEREFRAQIEAVLSTDLLPTHLDWHCMPDGGREDVFMLTERLALEYGMAMRSHIASHQAHHRAAGRPSIEFGVLDSYGIPTDSKRETFRALLRALPVGLSEWAVHPGVGNDESRAAEPGSWQVRALDYEFVLSAEAWAIIEDEGIVRMSYRDLQPFWQGQKRR